MMSPTVRGRNSDREKAGRCERRQDDRSDVEANGDENSGGKYANPAFAAMKVPPNRTAETRNNAPVRCENTLRQHLRNRSDRLRDYLRNSRHIFV